MREVAGVKKWTPALGWGLCIAALALMVVGALMQEGRADIEQSLAEHIGLLIGFASFPVLGALIASREPRNPMGWIFLAVGLSIGVLLPATEYAYISVVERSEPLPLTWFALWLEQWLWYPALGLIAPFTLLLFPDGKPPGRFWKLVGWVGAVSLGIIVLGATFQERFVIELDPDDTARLGVKRIAVNNPVGLDLAHVEDALGPIFAVFAVCAILGMVSLVVRFWRSRGDERQQMKLLTMAAVVVVVMSTLGDLLELPGFLFPLTLWMIPGAVAVAIFKHRLYDVDVIINRTLVYGALTGVLVLIYLASVFLLQSALTGITEDSDLAVAASTLAVAALFRPVRSRIQGFIDRRFNRRKYDAQQTLQEFSSRLRDDVDLEHLARDLTGVVRDTMQPAHVSVWLRIPHEVRPS